MFLLPCCVAVSRTLYFLVSALNTGVSSAVSAFWLAIGAGLCLWMAVFIFLPAPVRGYVLAHELTHAFWGYIMGASLWGMKISKSGGNVRLSESNFFVVLAPYFFPLYTLLVVGIYFLGSVFFYLERYFPLFLALTGFTLGFHFSFSAAVLGRRQSDIEEYGKTFSYPFIYFMNCLVICLLLVAISPLSLDQFYRRLAEDFAFVGSFIWELTLAVTVGGKSLLSGAIPK